MTPAFVFLEHRSMTTPTVVVLPSWLPWLFVCAVAVGTALGMIHMVAWPGQLRREALPIWATQIIGTSAIWIGLTVFWVLTFGDWLAPFVLAVFIAFAGLIPLTLRAVPDRPANRGRL